MNRLISRCATLLGALLLGIRGQQAVAQAGTKTADSITPDSITPAMIALGDSIFHGKAGRGTCLVCHGEDAKGNPGIAPSLRSGHWIHGDGSYGFILSTITTGVHNPKKGDVPMPAGGGTQFTSAQLHAVAAYVFSLTHPHH